MVKPNLSPPFASPTSRFHFKVAVLISCALFKAEGLVMASDCQTSIRVAAKLKRVKYNTNNQRISIVFIYVRVL